MNWLSSLFSSSNSKRQAFSSTHDAFSLPTSSPTFHNHPDAFNPDALNTPDPDSSTSPSYTYPPQGGSGAYGYVPTSAGLSSRPASASLLPMHHDRSHGPLSPSGNYPPLSHTWNRLRLWLDREYPELGDTLNYGILPQELSEIELQFGFALPAPVRESYLCCDGQEPESSAGCSEGLFFGLKLLPLENVLEEWRFWREVDDDPTTGANPQLKEIMQSIPPGWIRREYSQRGWIPLIADKVGNYVGIDLNPDEKGSIGQVIVFGRDFDTKVVLFRGDGPGGWARWLAAFVDELETGEGIEVGGADGSDNDSEDDLGYESYFYDGTGRGQGDGGGDTVKALRLTGEYRGWNVFEAWADRSLRRWHDAGLIPDASIIPPEEEPKGPITIVQDGATSPTIPILADVDEPAPVETTPVEAPVPNVPKIQVTRAPAPRPVDLPLPQDIMSIPESPHSSFDEDLEAGRSPGMSELPQESSNLPSSPPPAASASSPDSRFSPPSRRTQSQAAPASEAPATTGLGATGLVSPAEDTASSNSTGPSNPAEPIPDLLADPAPDALDTTKPIEPTSSSKSIPPISPPKTLEKRTHVISDSIASEADLDAELAATIRLVGGAGAADAIDKTEEPEAEADEQAEDNGVDETGMKIANGVKERDSDTASISSIASDASASNVGKNGKPHKKTKSGLAGIKRFSNLVPKKRDSTSSLKGPIGPTPPV